MPDCSRFSLELRGKQRLYMWFMKQDWPPDPNWYKFDWDAVVCFDHRYKEFLLKSSLRRRLRSSLTHVISRARRQKKGAYVPGLPMDKKIVSPMAPIPPFSYGPFSRNGETIQKLSSALSPSCTPYTT